MSRHLYRCYALSILSLCLVLSGCATRGPANSDQLPSFAFQALPSDAGTLLQGSPGEWFPNVKGFNDIRSNPFAPVSRQVGLVALTDKALYFEQWNTARKSYEVVKRLLLTQVRSITVDTYGASRRIVIQREDFGYDSFGVTQAGGLIVDKSETEILVGHLRKVLPDRVR